MSGIDDYNDRVRKQNAGMPVGPATNSVQASIDMAADADRRSRQARMSAPAGPSSGSDDYSFVQLLVVLGLSLAAAGLSLLAVAYILPKDWSFIGGFAAMAGFIFAAFAIFYLLKKAAGVALAGLFGAIGSLFQRRR